MWGVALGSGLGALEGERNPPWPQPMAVTLGMGILHEDGLGCQDWSCRRSLGGKDGDFGGQG